MPLGHETALPPPPPACASSLSTHVFWTADFSASPLRILCMAGAHFVDHPMVPDVARLVAAELCRDSTQRRSHVDAGNRRGAVSQSSLICHEWIQVTEADNEQEWKSSLSGETCLDPASPTSGLDAKTDEGGASSGTDSTCLWISMRSGQRCQEFPSFLAVDR